MGLKYGLIYGVLGVGILAGAVGCVSPSRSETSSLVFSGKPVATTTVYLVTSTSLAGLEVEKQQLTDALISGLNQSKMFENVTANRPSAGSGNGLKIMVAIENIKTVSAEARAWTGALAGRASIQIHTTVTDLKSDRQLAVFNVVGESGKSAFAGTTAEAIGQAAGQVVTEILKLNAQTEE
jgi:hypothetical protein